MKRLILLTVFVFAIAISNAETKPKLSPLTKKYLREIIKLNGELPRGFNYKHGTNQVYIGAVIIVNNLIDESSLNALDIKIGTRAGTIWTAQIPVANVEAITSLSGIDYIQLDEPTVSLLNSARADTHADSVHAGINLPMPYNGLGVVMGVVDAGFDYAHPLYFDSSGVGYRVKKVWMQKNATGPAPSGFSYGTEMTDSAALWAQGTDNGGIHATHVSGICAGSGFGSPGNLYRGFSYKSDMVLVGITPDKTQWVNTGVSDMIDGIGYVFDYATSVSKPAVVNLSWGSPLGPRDGTGLFSQALDNLVGPGRIFVCSAGNNGQDTIHIQKTFTVADTIVNTYLRIENTPAGNQTWVDVWGDSAKTFCAEVSLHNGTAVATTGFICLDDSVHESYLIGSNNDSLWVSLTTSASEFNNKPRIFIDFDSDIVSDSIMISVKGSDGIINFWNTYVYNTSGYYGAFKKMGNPNAVDGDHEMTMSDIASTKSAITVGAYASKVNWSDINGNAWTYSSYVAKGKLAPFSSRGPTADGRIKPDITGPGFIVGSAISSYDTSWSATGSNKQVTLNMYHNPTNNRDYPYGILYGTSMSSPAVAGIVGMLLQVNGSLTPQDLKYIFTQTAIKDAHTGAIPAGGDPAWGNGKINAYAAVQLSLQALSVNAISKSNLNCSLYPNPNDGSFILNYSANIPGDVMIEITDMTGKILKSEKWQANYGFNYKSMDVSKLSQGFYLTRITSDEGFSAIRMIIEK